MIDLILKKGYLTERRRAFVPPPKGSGFVPPTSERIEVMNRIENYLIPIITFHKEILVKGKGTYVYDTKGNKLLDLNSGQFCTVFGHSNEEVINCVKENAEKLVHTNSAMITDNVLSCAEKIHKISGDMKAYSILLSTGAEAVEFCIRFAKNIKKKEGIICFDRGYHGLTLGAQSITYSGVYTVPHVNHTFSVPIPEEKNQVESCLREFEDLLKQHAEVIAAAVLEPIVSVGGMLFPDRYYFEQVRQLCNKYNILLILDECQTGFGRTGNWFAYQEIGIIPDMVACAKGIGLGYPVSMVMFESSLVKEKAFTMTHYSSHQNDGFGAAIVEFGIDYIQKNDLLKSNTEKGIYFLEKLRELSQQNPIVQNPRGKGLMLGFDLKINGIENYRSVYEIILDMAVQKGVILQATNGGKTLRFLPSYLITKEEIDFSITVLHNILDEKKIRQHLI